MSRPREDREASRILRILPFHRVFLRYRFSSHLVSSRLVSPLSRDEILHATCEAAAEINGLPREIAWDFPLTLSKPPIHHLSRDKHIRDSVIGGLLMNEN